MKKMLFVLSPEKKWQRTLRRAIVVGVLTAIAVLLNAWLGCAPIILIPVITAVLAAIDKFVRDKK